jgi:hypothetical protein
MERLKKSFEGTWIIDEVRVAKRLGYKIVENNDCYHI